MLYCDSKLERHSEVPSSPCLDFESHILSYCFANSRHSEENWNQINPNEVKMGFEIAIELQHSNCKREKTAHIQVTRIDNN